MRRGATEGRERTEALEFLLYYYFGAASIILHAPKKCRRVALESP